jgi:uncharacterized repeat protein (TIGR01451 family)
MNRLATGAGRRWSVGLASGALVIAAALASGAPAGAAPTRAQATAAVAAVSECNIASNGSFESPHIQDPTNPTPNDGYANGYNQWRSGQPTISGWSTIAGTVDILRYFNNASDGAQSIDLWGTSPGTMQQTFTGLVPGVQYTFSIDYSGLVANDSLGYVSLDQGAGFVPLASLAPTVSAIQTSPAGGTPQVPDFTVTWATYTHSFTATGTSATIRLANQTAPTAFNTGLFIDNFSFVGTSPCQDFGDAPDSYGTTLENDGARNIDAGYDADTKTAPTMLGSTVDTEADGQPTGTATGDSVDEDGVSSPITIAHGRTSSVTVSATNNSAQDVTLAGWIDLNGDGQFEPAERVTTTVPANSGTADYTLTFPGGTATADTYARFRVYGSVVADPLPTGNAVGGEVEDYRVAVINPGLTAVKHAGTPVDVNGDGLTDAGDTIQYTFDVTNSGDVPITDVGVTDVKAGPVTCPDSTLAAGATETCTADAVYTVTPADESAGAVDNTAVATGTDPIDGTVTSPSSTTHTVATAAAPGLTLVKSADPSDAAAYLEGQAVTYRYVVTNTGNVTINGITISEDTFTGTGGTPTVDCPSTTLVAGAQEICTATYTLTLADVDNGSVQNSATVHGTPAGSGTDVPSNTSTVTIPETPAPALTVVKSVSPTAVTQAGQTLTYSFTVTNTGNVTITNPTVQDTGFTGTGQLLDSDIQCPETSLVPGQVETCTIDYTVTQQDVDAGTLSNSATVTGTSPDGGTTVSPPSPPATVTIERTPALTVQKTANVVAAEVDQQITYTFTVTNTGNVTITNPSVQDTNFSGTGQLSALDCPADVTLEPRDTLICSATYTVTQADIDSGELSNSAHVTGTPPVVVTPPTADAPPVTITTSPDPVLSFTKTASAQKVTKAGQVLTYTFTVTNVGNVDINDPEVNEGTFTGHGTLSAVTCPDDSMLAPGEAMTCTATYTVDAADLTGGTLSNTATASGTTLDGTTITSDPSTAAVAEAGPAKGLALTGTDAGRAGLVGLALLALGLLSTAAVWLRRRPRRDPASGTD